MSGSGGLSASIWVYVLLLLAPFAAALSEVSAVKPEIDDRDDDIHANMTTSLKPTTTLSTAVSTSGTQEVGIELVEKKGGGAGAAAGGAGGAGVAAHASKGAGPKTISFDTMWPLMLNPLPQMLAPLLLAKLAVGSETSGAPPTDILEDDNNLGLMPMVTTATPVQASTPAIRLSKKKEFKFGSGSGGSSLEVDRRPKAMTMLILCVLPLLSSLALTSAFLF
ncbi:hypothetical protein IAQ61_003950 [Plenodomus lingam]|uniref:uncharacterized protein n=1 Tax=Leptosphaeria maculans TaxID=5022 RepID=UPI0033196A2F|nr:hypothetical protein IAQ61_003950 [Plenodomus lingam]